MGTRDFTHGNQSGHDQAPPPMKRQHADKNIPLHRQRPGKVPITGQTKYQDTEQTVDHNPLSGRPKSA